MATLALTTAINVSITLESLPANPLSPQGKDSFSQTHNTKVVDGTGDNTAVQAKVPWGIRKTLTPGQVVDINIMTLDGARDADGAAISLSRVALVAALGTTGQNADGKIVFGGGGTAAFSGPFAGVKASKVQMGGSGKLILEDFSVLGYPVAADESILRVTNTGTAATKIVDIFVLGS